MQGNESRERTKKNENWTSSMSITETKPIKMGANFLTYTRHFELN